MQNYKELYECLVYELQRAKEDAQSLYDNYKEEGLTFNSIEAEGYLRGALYCFNSVKHVEDMFSIEEETDS